MTTTAPLPLPDAAPDTAVAPPPPPAARGWAARVVRGRPEDPSWVRPALAALLGCTAVAYLWGLDRSGWANSFYSAAVQAGTTSWKAMFFGSFDAANLITVDKPPASLWVMEAFARVFGLSSWSVLVPQALEGVATVAVLYATVRRWTTAGTGLLAGAALATTPVAALMFRFNNPDALLVLLLVAASWATTVAVQRASWRLLALAGALVGLGFITKMGQALLVVPALALVYLVAAPTTLGARVRHLLGAGAALVVAGGWWVAVVQLWPASSRPYIGGSQDNSVLGLILGYNGIGRLTGNETGSVTGGTGGGSPWGPTGWYRLLTSSFGGQIAWLLPAALVATLALLVARRGTPRTDPVRAFALLWGGSLVVTALVISYSAGIIHPYYTVALAPSIAALSAAGAVYGWVRRDQWPWRAGLAATLLATTALAWVLLDRSPTWLPGLRVAVVVAGVAAAAGLLVAHALTRRLAVLLATVSVAAALAAPTAYAVQTVVTPHSGSLPSAGPTVAGGFGPGGRGGRPGGAGAPTGLGAPPAGPAGAAGGPGGGLGAPGAAGAPVGATGGTTGPGGAAGTAGRGGGPGGGAGGLLSASSPPAALVAALDANASHYTWVAAAVGSQTAAGLQLASGHSVMALGGVNGSDPYPSLSAFEALVASGKVHYFVGGSGPGASNGGSSDSSAIATWVASHFRATTIGGTTVYDLSQPATAA